MAKTMLSADEVRAIAHLARLELDESDVARYQKQLSAVLDYFQKLEELDTSQVDTAASALPLPPVMRPDEAEAALPVEAAVANAPDSDGAQFRAPAALNMG